ncbi:MAG: hypothetical protein VX569_05625 [Pseudomonadota bacterium]|nr:hypothetical protein [Pseudomonadota bacterium]
MAALRRALAAAERVAITHESPAVRPGSAGETVWAELLIDGLTFDLDGLAPGPGFPIDRPRHLFEAPPELVEKPGEALALGPGQHLAGGRATLPVVRAQLALGAELLRVFPGITALSWPPARCLMGRGFFLSLVDAWLAGGPFPALGLTAFRRALDGAVQSEGLAFFTGQELHFDPVAFPDPVEASRIGVRLVHEMVGLGRLTEPAGLAAPDGAALALRPSRNGRFVRVTRG